MPALDTTYLGLTLRSPIVASSGRSPATWTRPPASPTPAPVPSCSPPCSKRRSSTSKSS